MQLVVYHGRADIHAASPWRAHAGAGEESEDEGAVDNEAIMDWPQPLFPSAAWWSVCVCVWR